jgi:subtilisin family serine protease
MESKKPLVIFAALLSLILASCSEKSDDVGTFSQPTVQCASKAVSDRFIVEWADGHITVEQAPTQKSFLSGFFREKQKEIKRAEHDYQVQLHDFWSSDVPVATGSEDHDPINWGQAASQAETLWSQLNFGQNVLVAVVDTGSDTKHPQLSTQLYVNKNEIAGNGIDDDKNGYIDDVSGWNYVKDSPDMSGSINHGTHVAGVIVANHSAGAVKGLAPNSRLIPLKFIDGNAGYLGAAIEAIDYAAAEAKKNNQPLVINASWGGGDCSEVLKEKMQGFKDQRVLFSVAAGNDSLNIDVTPVFPAAFNLGNQITVSAYSARNLMASFSNYGKLSQLVAPGVDVYSTVPGGYQYYHGTSMAAPFVSGAAALLWGKYPEASSTDIREALLSSVTSGPYSVNTKGSLNIALALQILAKRLGH